MFTSGEVSKLLGIPSSSLRRYVSEFSEYLSREANRRRGRRFTEHDVEIIATIRGLTQEGKKLEDIGPLLTDVITKPSTDGDVDEPETSSTLTLIYNRLEQTSAVITQLQQQNASYEERIRILEEKNRPFWERLRRPRG